MTLTTEGTTTRITSTALLMAAPALLGSLGLLLLAAAWWIDVATHEVGGDGGTLVGLVYVFSLVVAAPGLAGTGLSVAALLVRHRSPRTAVGLSAAALSIIGLMGSLWLMLFLQS